MKKDIETMKQYEDYSVEELKAALQRYFLYSDLDDEAVDEMERILAVLRKKAPFHHPHTAEEMWEEFKEEHEDELNALGIRQESETEEVVEKEPEIPVVKLHAEAEPAERRPKRYRGILRVGLIAATVVVLMIVITVAASAMGFNLWGWIPVWSDEDVRFVSETPREEPREDDVHSIPSVLASLGITEPLYPTWLPEDMERAETKSIIKPLFLYENYQGNNRELSITISPTTGSETASYQKEDSLPLEYVVGNTIHYIFDNTNNILAVWYTETYSTVIAGNISVEEMKTLIDSVYEVRK